MIFILGGSGYVGSAFVERLTARGLLYRSISRRECDYTQPGILLDLLRNERPEIVINAAGYTGKPNVDACEDHKIECLHGNAVFPGVVAEACERNGITWGHVSSGCIYNGRRSDGEGFREDDSPNFSFRQNNCSFYSGTKALGEEILESFPKGYVWRLRIPFDNRENPRNYLTKMMRYGRLLDAENSLSHLQDFVSTCLDCLEKGIPFGTYNMTNPGSVSTREVVAMIQESGVCTREPEFFSDEAEFMTAVRAPRSNCVLDTSKLAAAGIGMRPVGEALKDALARWTSATVSQPE